jgi:hypothetical protein
VTSSSSTESTATFTASDGRKFAFPVGTAFLVLAAILWWRDRPTLMWVMTSLGAVLYVAGLVMPAGLGPVYRAWMRMALAISKVTTPIFMGVVYFVVFTPSGWLMRLVGNRPIVHRAEKGSLWQATTERTKSDMRRQF